ncbi:MAG: glycosyltransferase family 2 protein [Gemmataceae bacterium]|nr:glycosyltransferase family 2 protein [Gemmataceae bacterium]MCI0737540.1 glycosyltransferase family 2 protein [Gemmataceae bacterium]
MPEQRIVSLQESVPVSVLGPMVSILVPCCGMLEYTKLCVPSVLRHSRSPFEIVFIDIGSLDGTAEYLAGIKAANSVRVEIVRTHTDMGIGQAVKEVLYLAKGEYVALLNNDTVVTHGWLNQLIALASISPALGIIGPMSNYAAPPQLVETVPYRIGPKKGKVFGGASAAAAEEFLVDTRAVDEFARQHRESSRGKWLETERLGGFCLLIKRVVLDRIGPALEKWSDLSLFDSDILSAKAREAGFTLGVCRDLFIHHFGTRTFAHGAAPDQTKAHQGSNR